MSKLIITRGLSGSGKTTWAKDFCAADISNRHRVNRDDLRSMLFGGYQHGHEFEVTVTKIQQDSIRTLLRRGHTVVVDDTNLALKHARQFSKIAFEEGAEFDVIDHFLQVPLEECIARDAARDSLKRVGEKVIRAQYERFGLKRGLPPVPPYEPTVDRPGELYVPVAGTQKVIICDIDGTLALMGDRGPFEWHRVGEDTVNRPVAGLLELVENFESMCIDRAVTWVNEPQIIFLSGRDEVCRPETEAWLSKAGFSSGEFKLYMRPEGDNRRDSVVKLELFDRYIRYNYDVQFVLDDRDQVVEMWRGLGLACFQVAPGAF